MPCFRRNDEKKLDHRDIADNTENSENLFLFLLPPFAYSETSLEKISGIAWSKNAGIVLCSPNHTGQHIYFFGKNGKFQHLEISLRPMSSDREILRFDFGPARVHLADPDMLYKPEHTQ